MDSKEELPMDMVEQLLKFVPTNEERALLDERSGELDVLSRADRFLHDVSKYVYQFVRARNSLMLCFEQNNALRATVEHTFLQEEIRPNDQRN